MKIEVDILENDILKKYPGVLDILLRDHTTQKNIFWATNNYQQNLLNLTIGNINAWQPMEYDLWIDPSSDYYNQIKYDINLSSLDNLIIDKIENFNL